ncbi:MAG: multicopper oxidase family protein [Geminicoccaceae bacterium]
MRSSAATTRRKAIGGGLALAAGGLLAGGSRPAGAGLSTVEATIIARPTVLEIGGQRVGLLTYDGVFPGPVLRARAGDLLRLEFANEIDEPTNLHFHGLHVSPEGNADNPFVTVQPGERFLYELPIPPGYGGTFWYHPHMHHRLARQLWRGLAGALIVERPEDAALAGCDEQVVVIKDLTVVDGRPAPHTNADWARGKSGELVLANGQVRPVVNASRSPVWLRLINACNGRALLLAREDGRPLTVLALDGHLLETPQTLPEILMTPAQRVELLVPLSQGEQVALVYRPYNRGARREPSQVERLLTLEGSGPAAAPLPERLAAVERLDPAAVANRRGFKMAMAFLHADGSTAQEHVPIQARLGDLECWEIVNVDTQDHVFHLHTWPFQVWRRNGVAESAPAWRDTINLRPAERVELLIPFRDIAGKSLFHCHIAEHGDAGMMGIIEVSPDLPPSGRTRPRPERADLDRAWPPGADPGSLCGPGAPDAAPG